jgi:hypothetical protein
LEPRPTTASMPSICGDSKLRFAAMLGLTFGELFVVVFIVVAVVSAAWWPRAGAALFEALVGDDDSRI